jgi:hypothetical protein
VIQEIFGVNHHIRAVCDRLANAGYVAIAPSIFDRIEPNFQCGYSPDEIANARKFVANPDWAAMPPTPRPRSTRSRMSGRLARLLPRGSVARGGDQTVGLIRRCRLIRRRHRPSPDDKPKHRRSCIW